MSFKVYLAKAIRKEATKLIQRDQRYSKEVSDELFRIQRRSGVEHAKQLLRPSYWQVDKGFDPYHVRSNADAIAHAIDSKLKSRRYRPMPAVRYEVPKADGSPRPISVFQIADNALSKVVFTDLMKKNAPRFSARCYAYRTDITLHDAVLHISTQMKKNARFFVAEFDYRKFFASLNHEFLRRLISHDRFLLTQRERRILIGFLEAPVLGQKEYNSNATLKRETGIPEGTSVSLFLANAAGSYLDEKLEQLGVGFARYADDTLVWSNNYSALLTATDVLSEVGEDLGVSINLRKSEGISILARDDERTEMRSKASVKFIGYSISRTNISMADSNVKKTKKRISEIIYRNLLQPLAQENLRSERVQGTFDRDYYVMILQIRRYLYGGMSERKLRRFNSQSTARIHFKGLMSFYPIVDDEPQLKNLDGWLLHTVFTSLRKRRQYLKSNTMAIPTPCDLDSKKELLTLFSRTHKGNRVDLRLPSFLKMARLVRRMARLFGANQVANNRPTPYYND